MVQNAQHKCTQPKYYCSHEWVDWHAQQGVKVIRYFVKLVMIDNETC